MIELNKKYKANTINNSELVELKKRSKLLTDKQLSLHLEHEWELFQNETIKNDKLTEKSLYNIKKRVSRQIKESSSKRFLKNSFSTAKLHKRMMQFAAILILPLLLISTLYFYNETKILESADMIVSTGKGEFANITLPDGTKVVLNSESTLSYVPHLFNKKSRSISFEGEAYFNVSKKDKENPFSIKTTDIDVTVLGTKFNLLARNVSKNVSLSLEEGKVLFTSLRTGENKILIPNQIANLLKSTGKINVTDLSDTNIASWRDKKSTFRNTPFKDIISYIERNYGVKIDFDKNMPTIQDHFSGVIPSNNLIEAIQIIEVTYYLKSTINGNKVVLFSTKQAY